MELMTSFLDSIGAFFTESIGWVGELLTTITSNAPLTVVVFGMGIVGFTVGLLRRLVNVN